MDQVRKNWVIILAAFGGVVFYANSGKDIAQAYKDIQRLEATVNTLQLKTETVSQQFYSMSGDMREIKTSLDFIKEKLSQ